MKVYVLSTTPSYTARDNQNQRLIHTTYLHSTTLPATQVAAITYKQHDAFKSTRATPNQRWSQTPPPSARISTNNKITHVTRDTLVDGIRGLGSTASLSISALSGTSRYERYTTSCSYNCVSLLQTSIMRLPSHSKRSLIVWTLGLTFNNVLSWLCSDLFVSHAYHN